MHFSTCSRPRRKGDKGSSNSKVNGRTNHHKVERENLDETVEPKKERVLVSSMYNSVQHSEEGLYMEMLAREY